MKTQGFSLIELMITISVIGVLSAISVASYQNNIVSTNRAEATTQILMIQSVYESIYSQTYSYPAADTLPPLPSIPNTANYSYSTTVPAPGSTTGYLITATPTGNQLINDTTCPTITLDNLGNTGPSNACWNS